MLVRSEGDLLHGVENLGQSVRVRVRVKHGGSRDEGRGKREEGRAFDEQGSEGEAVWFTFALDLIFKSDTLCDVSSSNSCVRCMALALWSLIL